MYKVTNNYDWVSKRELWVESVWIFHASSLLIAFSYTSVRDLLPLIAILPCHSLSSRCSEWVSLWFEWERANLNSISLLDDSPDYHTHRQAECSQPHFGSIPSPVQLSVGVIDSPHCRMPYCAPTFPALLFSIRHYTNPSRSNLASFNLRYITHSLKRLTLISLVLKRY